MKVTACIYLFLSAVTEEQGFDIIFTHTQVLLYPFSSIRTYEYWPVFLALTSHHELSSFQVDMVFVERYKLRYTKSTTEQKFQYCTIPESG
jgi:hypothetical protein